LGGSFEAALGESLEAAALSGGDFFDEAAVSSATGLKLATATGDFVLVLAPGVLKLATAAETFGDDASGDFELVPRALAFWAEIDAGAVGRGATGARCRAALAGARRARNAFVSFSGTGTGMECEGAGFAVAGRCTGACRCFSRDAFHARASGATDTMAVRRTRNLLPERDMLPIHPNERSEAKNPGTYESAYERALTPSG
jgi:hypothetical protein